jgi:hypothetical protein
MMIIKVALRLLIIAGILPCVQAAGQVGNATPNLTGTSPLSGSTLRLFGEHKHFTANLEMVAQGEQAGEKISLEGRLAYSEGRSRFEMDLSQLRSTLINTQAPAQITALGLNKITAISRPDRRISYVIYPGLKAYAQQSLREQGDGTGQPAPELEVTETGRETIEKIPCLKNRVVIRNADGKNHEATVWNAPDLRNFPVRIDHTEGKTHVSLFFRNVKLVQPGDALFEPPADYRRYDSVQALLQGALLPKSEVPGTTPATAIEPR